MPADSCSSLSDNLVRPHCHHNSHSRGRFFSATRGVSTKEVRRSPDFRPTGCAGRLTFYPVEGTPCCRRQKLSKNFYFSSFSGAPPDIPANFQGYPVKKFAFLGFRGTNRTFWPLPLHVEDPTGRDPDPKV